MFCNKYWPTEVSPWKNPKGTGTHTHATPHTHTPLLLLLHVFFCAFFAFPPANTRDKLLHPWSNRVHQCLRCCQPATKSNTQRTATRSASFTLGCRTPKRHTTPIPPALANVAQHIDSLLLFCCPLECQGQSCDTRLLVMGLSTQLQTASAAVTDATDETHTHSLTPQRSTHPHSRSVAESQFQAACPPGCA